jgi:hypothetical protein
MLSTALLSLLHALQRKYFCVQDVAFISPFEYHHNPSAFSAEDKTSQTVFLFLEDV